MWPRRMSRLDTSVYCPMKLGVGMGPLNDQRPRMRPVRAPAAQVVQPMIRFVFSIISLPFAGPLSRQHSLATTLCATSVPANPERNSPQSAYATVHSSAHCAQGYPCHGSFQCRCAHKVTLSADVLAELYGRQLAAAVAVPLPQPGLRVTTGAANHLRVFSKSRSKRIRLRSARSAERLCCRSRRSTLKFWRQTSGIPNVGLSCVSAASRPNSGKVLWRNRVAL